MLAVANCPVSILNTRFGIIYGTSNIASMGLVTGLMERTNNAIRPLSFAKSNNFSGQKLAVFSVKNALMYTVLGMLPI